MISRKAAPPVGRESTNDLEAAMRGGGEVVQRARSHPEGWGRPGFAGSKPPEGRGSPGFAGAKSPPGVGSAWFRGREATPSVGLPALPRRAVRRARRRRGKARRAPATCEVSLQGYSLTPDRRKALGRTTLRARREPPCYRSTCFNSSLRPTKSYSSIWPIRSRHRACMAGLTPFWA